MGELLKATDRNKGTAGTLRGRDSSGSPILVPPEDNTPTLAELGITKKESSEAQYKAEKKIELRWRLDSEALSSCGLTWWNLPDSHRGKMGRSKIHDFYILS